MTYTGAFDLGSGGFPKMISAAFSAIITVDSNRNHVPPFEGAVQTKGLSTFLKHDHNGGFTSNPEGTSLDVVR